MSSAVATSSTCHKLKHTDRALQISSACAKPMYPSPRAYCPRPAAKADSVTNSASRFQSRSTSAAVTCRSHFTCMHSCKGATLSPLSIAESRCVPPSIGSDGRGPGGVGRVAGQVIQVGVGEVEKVGHVDV